MRYFKTFHNMTGANPFIWGGNFNTGLIQLAALLRNIDRRYMIKDRDTSIAEQPGNTNVVFSNPLRYQRGDLALTFGLRAAQVNSEVGRFYNGASADHDLVITKVFVPARAAGTTDAGHSVTSPPQKKNSSGRAAQPAPRHRHCIISLNAFIAHSHRNSRGARDSFRRLGWKMQ